MLQFPAPKMASACVRNWDNKCLILGASALSRSRRWLFIYSRLSNKFCIIRDSSGIRGMPTMDTVKKRKKNTLGTYYSPFAFLGSFEKRGLVLVFVVLKITSKWPGTRPRPPPTMSKELLGKPPQLQLLEKGWINRFFFRANGR